MAIRGHQWPSVAIRGHQRSSEAIRGHQRHLGRDDKRSRLRRRERRRRLGDSISIIQPDRCARAQPDFKKGSQRHRRHAVKVRNGRGRACNRLDGFPIGGLNPHAFVRMQRGRQVGGALLAASRQVGLQAHSVHLTGGQSGRPSEVIRGHQRSSEVISGHQRSSEVIRGHQRGHQRASERPSFWHLGCGVDQEDGDGHGRVLRPKRQLGSRLPRELDERAPASIEGVARFRPADAAAELT